MTKNYCSKQHELILIKGKGYWCEKCKKFPDDVYIEDYYKNLKIKVKTK